MVDNKSITSSSLELINNSDMLNINDVGRLIANYITHAKNFSLSLYSNEGILFDYHLATKFF